MDSFIARRNSDSILFEPLRLKTQRHTQTSKLDEIFEMDRRKRVYSLEFLSKDKSNFYDALLYETDLNQTKKKSKA